MIFNWIKKQKQKQNTNIINFGLPNLSNNFFLNRYLIILQKQNPQYFYDNHKIDFVYGCFPYSIWSLNQKNNYTHLTTIDIILNFYKKNNISVKLMFNNDLIKQEQLFDTFSNIILKKAHYKNNAIFASSDILEKYIKKNYPLYNIIKITALHNTRKNVLIDGCYNHLINIKDLKYKNSTYLYLNQFCSLECPLYNFHKQYNNNEHIHYIENERSFPCELKNNLMFYDIKENKNFITLEKIKEFQKEGIFNYLISDNSMLKNTKTIYNTYDLIESYIYYLIKPEFQLKVRNMLIKEYTDKKNLYKNKESRKNEKI